MRNVYLITHAQSVHHVEHRVGGWYDTSLTDLGRDQATKIGLFLKDIVSGVVQLYSSDLKRAAETAEIISEYLGVSVSLDERLREMSYGEAGGKPQEWFNDRIKCQPDDGNRLDHRVYAGAESRREVAERVTVALNDMLREGAQDTVIVSHGFASTFLIMAWMKIPVRHMGYCNFYAKPATITLLREDELFGNRGVSYLFSRAHLG